MQLEEERLAIVDYGKRLITHNLTTGTGGNISILNREKGVMAISPSGIDYFETQPDDVVVMDLDGTIIEGDRKPSVEHDLHRIFYSQRSDIGSVIHTHSTFSVVLAALGWSIPATFYLTALAGGPDVRCAKYARYGTQDLAMAAFEAMRGRNAALLANHGLIVGGPNVAGAFMIAEQIEFSAQVFYRAKCVGEPTLVPDAEINDLVASMASYGQGH